jgi:xanthine dehydrogenase accessory factor
MENLDLTVIRALSQWRHTGRHALLATVMRTWGSSPRPVGSIMALADDGSVVGSVSGGCIEDDLIARYRGRIDAAAQARPTVVTYGITADEAHRFGLPCGGTLELLIEHDPDAASLGTLVAALEEGRPMRRAVAFADGAVQVHRAEVPGEPHRAEDGFVNSFGPAYRMLLVGAGQLAEYLATMATFSGFSVTLCDPRVEYRSTWSMAGVAVTTRMPDDAVRDFRPDHRSCVVALAHDPKLDDLALLEALDSDAFYVGAIGSRRNAEARRQRMEEHFGHTAESLARLRGPIGIYIGSKTPPEIAVSVMAEILAVKNGVALPREIEVASAKAQREEVQRGVGCETVDR